MTIYGATDQIYTCLSPRNNGFFEELGFFHLSFTNTSFIFSFFPPPILPNKNKLLAQRNKYSSQNSRYPILFSRNLIYGKCHNDFTFSFMHTFK